MFAAATEAAREVTGRRLIQQPFAPRILNFAVQKRVLAVSGRAGDDLERARTYRRAPVAALSETLSIVAKSYSERLETTRDLEVLSSFLVAKTEKDTDTREWRGRTKGRAAV